MHRANFDAVDFSPVRYIIFTQGHVDHVGGLDSVRDPNTTVVAQANWTLWRDDNERLIPYRASRSAFAFKETWAAGIQAPDAPWNAQLPRAKAGRIDVGPDLRVMGHENVFAIGDVRSGSVKRVASGVGEGSVVIQAVHRFLHPDAG